MPYKGSGPALVDLLAGRTQMMMDIIVSALPMVQSGKLRDNFSKRGADAAFVEGARFAETVKKDSVQWAEIVRITGARAD